MITRRKLLKPVKDIFPLGKKDAGKCFVGMASKNEKLLVMVEIEPYRKDRNFIFVSFIHCGFVDSTKRPIKIEYANELFKDNSIKIRWKFMRSRGVNKSRWL